MKIVAMIPARMDSSRLPHKGMLNILGRPVLWYLVQRLRKCHRVDEIALITSPRPVDEPLVKWAKKIDIKVYRGNLQDVLGRFYQAALRFKADIAVKANGDCPLLAPEVIDTGLKEMEDGKWEFLTGKNKYTGLPVGAGAEIITIAALTRLNNLVKTEYHRENITTYIFENPDKFKWDVIKVLDCWKAPEMSWILDTIDDFNKIKAIIEELENNNSEKWEIEEIIEVYKNV